MESIQQQQEVAQRKQGNKRCVGGGGDSGSGGKKKNKKKNKSKSNRKEKKKGKQNKSGSAISYCEDDADDDSTVVSKSNKKKKNKTKSSKKEKGTTTTKDQIDTSVIINDGYYKYDKRLEELEKLESKLLEESGLLQKEREVLGFERESIEIQLNEEFHRCDDLTIRVKELEHIVQSHKLSNAGNKYAESIDEKVELKAQYENEINELNKRLLEKDNEIEHMKHIATSDLKILKGDEDITGNNSNSDNGNDNDSDFDPTSNNIADINGKSRERLQGELLQTVAKLTEKENKLKLQSMELDLAQEELDLFRDGIQTNQFKTEITTLQQENKDLGQELSKEKTNRSTKLKEKDETITFLMNELVRFKQEQSISSSRPLVR